MMTPIQPPNPILATHQYYGFPVQFTSQFFYNFVQFKALCNKMAIRVSGVVSFANYELLLKKCNKKLDKINTVGGNQKPVSIYITNQIVYRNFQYHIMILCFKLFIIDLKSVPYIDQTACKALIEWIESVDDKAHLAIVAHDGSKSLS